MIMGLTTDTAESPKKEYKVSGFQAGFILATSFLLYTVNYMDRQVFSVVLEPMRIELGLTDSQVGTMNSIFYFSMALFAIPTSFLLDRWSRKKAMSLMAVIWSVATFLTGLGRNFGGVLIPRIGVGIGEAAFAGGGTAIVSASYPQHLRSRVVGIFNMAAPMGAMLGTLLGGYLSAHFGGWRTPFFIFAVPGIIFGIMALFFKDYKTVKEIDETGRTKGFFASALGLFKIPSLRWLYIGYGMQQLVSFSFLVWGPAFIMRSQTVSEAKAGLIVGVLALMAIIGVPVGGIIADLWQKKNPRGRIYVPFMSILISSIFFVLAVSYNFRGVGFVFGMLWGLISTLGIGVINGATQDVVSPGQKGLAAASIAFYMVIFGGGWAPWLIGVFSDMLGGGANGLKIAFYIVTSGAVFASICYWISSKHYPSDMEKVKNTILESD